MVRVSYVLVMALGVAPIVVQVGCHHGAPASSPVSSPAVRPTSVATADILSFLPADADVVIGVDARALRAGEVWAEYSPQLLDAAGPALPALVRDCGFDPVTAVDSVVIGVRSSDVDSGVLVVRGFDRELATRCLVQHPWLDEKTAVDGNLIVSTYRDGTTDFATFADHKTAVLISGRGASRQQVAAAVASGAPLRKSPSLVAMLDALSTGASVWFVIGRTSLVFDKVAGIGGRPIGAYGTLRLAAGVSFQARVRFASPAQASQVASAIEAQLQQARVLVDQISARAEGSAVALRLEISSAKLRSLVDQFGPMLKILLTKHAGAPRGKADGDEDGDGEDRD